MTVIVQLCQIAVLILVRVWERLPLCVQFWLSIYLTLAAAYHLWQWWGRVQVRKVTDA